MNYDDLDVDALERALNPRVAVANAQDLLAEFAARAATARERLNGRHDIAYGATPFETLDVFPAAQPGAPIQVFFHGGYWRSLDKSDLSFFAVPLVDAGATVVLANYGLCPAVSLDEIVRQARAAVAWVWRNAADLGGDARRIHVSGHSAGGQLAAMALSHDWAAEGLPGDLVKGVFSISGLFELEPLMRISVNQDLRLDAAMARRNSPTLDPPPPGARLTVTVGANETAGFIAQSRDFHETCVRNGVASEFMAVPGADHFTVMFDLADPSSAQCRALTAQMGLA
jgi:arylformamidase